jgi:hypothetical protein
MDGPGEKQWPRPPRSAMIFDSEPPKPKTGIRKYIPLPLLIIIVVAIGALLYLAFRNYPEQKVVEHFLNTLEQGNYQEAYAIWQGSPRYSYEDFLHDWGPQGDYGKIREFHVLSAQTKGKQSVIVTVRINNQTPPLNLVVDRKTKGIAYSPF